MQRTRAEIFIGACIFASAAGAVSGCTSAWNDHGPPPFSAAETNNALAPVKPLQARCYAASDSARDRRPAQLEFVLYVDERGQVHSEPQAAPLDPPLIECLRTGLDQLQFPAKGETDQLHLSFDLQPDAAKPSQP